MSLNALFAPRGVAVVGASDNPRKFGGLTLENLIRGGYGGHIVPINPQKGMVMGVEAYRSILDIPVPVDVVAVAVPKRYVPEIVEQSAAMKIPYVMVMSGGYGEQGADGLSEERSLVKLARDLGVRIVGPNLLGMASTPSRLLLNASLAMREVAPRTGGVSLVSQSGASMGVIFNRGAREGVCFRHLIALGNQADLELSEIIHFYAEDHGTRVVIVSLEGLKDPMRFLDAARLCHQAGKPLIAVKAGRTKEGAKVTATHTGSMASDYSGFAAKLEEVGVVLRNDEFSMMRLAAMYDRYGNAPATGGVALMSPSGGAIAQTADRLSERNVRLASFSTETVRRLERIYVRGLATNPLDFANLHDNSFLNVGDGGAAIVAEDSDVAAIVAVLGTAHNLDELVAGMAAGVAGRKPLVCTVLPGSNGDKARITASEHGLLALDSIEDSVELLESWMRPLPSVCDPSPRPAGLAAPDFPESLSGQILGEFEAKQLLRSYGVNVPREIKCRRAEEAIAAADAIGYPVAIKGYGPSLVHKSDVGAVRLELASGDAVRNAWEDITAKVGAGLEGCLVAEMVDGEVEIIVGSLRSEDFGPMVMFGAGGVLAELLEDFVLLPAPAHPDAIRAKLRQLKIMKLLSGFRGRPSCDVDALVDAVHRISHFVADYSDRVEELDVNPVLVGARGHGVVAVDARIRLCRRAEQEHLLESAVGAGG